MLVVVCASSDPPPTPDYDGLRKEDDTKHAAYPPPPAATANTGWPQLAPAPGKSINMGAQGGTDMDSGLPDTGIDTGVRDTGSDVSVEALISSYVYVSGGTRLSSSVVDDPSLTITRTGSTLFTIRSTYSYLYFTWTASNANLAGFGIQFGSEPYLYLRSSSFSTSGSSSMEMYVSTTVCPQLPSTCYMTTMRLYAFGQPFDGGVSGGISAPVSVPVAIDCGGCL